MFWCCTVLDVVISTYFNHVNGAKCLIHINLCTESDLFPFLFSCIKENKRPMWATVAHLSTMNAACFLSSFAEFRSAVSEEKSKMSQPIRGQGGHFVFPIGPQKNKLGRGRWDLASYQVSLNSVQRFQRSWKCLGQSEARAAILFFRSARKTQTW